MSTKTTTARVRSVEPLDGFVLRLSFDDGTEREVDLGGELWGEVFEPLREDRELFRQVSVDAELGTIVWPNGADMDPDVLHGDFEPARSAATDAVQPPDPEPEGKRPSRAIWRLTWLRLPPTLSAR